MEILLVVLWVAGILALVIGALTWWSGHTLFERKLNRLCDAMEYEPGHVRPFLLSVHADGTVRVLGGDERERWLKPEDDLNQLRRL